MQYTQEKLLSYLTQNHIAYKLYSHIPLFTCEQAKTVVAELNMPGAEVKNLFLKDSKKQFWHIIATYNTKIDLKITGKTLGTKELRFADAVLLMHYLGVEPGSVTPLAQINDTQGEVTIIIDAQLLKAECLQVHPLKNDATIIITPLDLLKFFGLINKSYAVYDFDKHEIKGE